MENMEKEIINIVKNIKKINVVKITNILRKEMKNYMFLISIHLRSDLTFYIDDNNYNQTCMTWINEIVISYDCRYISKLTKLQLKEQLIYDIQEWISDYIRSNLKLEINEKTWKLYIRD